MSEIILGAVYRAEADSILGWCWNPSHPQLQCVVEVLLDGVVWRALSADRRNEGARLNGPPHDHFGFLVVLPPRTGKAWHRVEVRERRTGTVFGRLMQGGEDPGVALLGARIDGVRREAEAMTAALADFVAPVAVDRALAVLGKVLTGEGLRRPIVLPWCDAPAVSVILVGCKDADVAYRAVAAVASVVVDWGGELLLAGDVKTGGVNTGDLAGLASVLRGVGVVDDAAPAAALAAARGARVLVLDGARVAADPAPGLEQREGAAVILAMSRADLALLAPCVALDWAAAVADFENQAGLSV